MNWTLKQMAIVAALGVLSSFHSTSTAQVSHNALRREFDRAISRWLVRDSSGRYLLLAIQTTPERERSLLLRISANATPRSLADFSTPVVLPVSRDAFAAGIAVDAKDGLHLAWSTESGSSWYSILDLKRNAKPEDFGKQENWLNPNTSMPGAIQIASARSSVGDIGVGPDGGVFVTWTGSQPDHHTILNIGTVRDGHWRSFRLLEGYGLAPPSLLLDRGGRFHLAWHDIYEDAWHLTGSVLELESGRQWQPRKLKAHAYRPALAAVSSDRLVGAYESSLGSVQAVFLDENQVRTSALAATDPRLVHGTSHSPQMTLDRFGVPWLFFVDSARQRVFYTRWLGSEWGPILNGYWLTRNSPRMEDNHLSIDRVVVESKMRAGAAGFGVSLLHDSLYPEQSFHLMPVPSLHAAPGKKILFFDLAEIQTLDGLVLKMDEARKFAGNPVIQRGASQDFDSERAGNFVSVLKENGVYRMWYVGLHREPEVKPWPAYYRVGYAESVDGLSFKKIQQLPGLPYVPTVLNDPTADPRQRYKMLKFFNVIGHVGDARSGFEDPWDEAINGILLTSPDGVHWSEVKAEMLFPGGRPDEFIPQSLFHDAGEPDPAKRYKAYGFSSLNAHRRGGYYAYSADAIHWTAHPQNPVLDPFARNTLAVRGGKYEQIHDAFTSRYGDFYLAFYQYQHHGEKLDVELAASRDGENFFFVNPGSKLIQPGGKESFDCDMVTASPLLVDGDEIRIYYGGICGDFGGAGLARLRLDGFTHLEPKSGRKEGNLTTIPITRGTASELFVNVDNTDQSRISIELLDAATDRPIPGWSLNEAIPVTGNSVAMPVRWKGQDGLGSLPVTEFRIKVHFYSSGSVPKLYSIQFR